MVVVQKLNSTTNTTSLKREFASVVRPLEEKTGTPLGNPHRAECFRAFEHYPDGVREVARRVLADAEKNPNGLFVYRIRNGWHELEPLPAAPPPDDLLAGYNCEAEPVPAAPPAKAKSTSARGRGQCFVCGECVDDALLQGGQWWCHKHEHEAA
ncbi:MAG: hypothetical protein ACYDA3_00745 [Gaiellaceae bacterium]